MIIRIVSLRAIAAAFFMTVVLSHSARAADPIAFGPADSYGVSTTPFRMASGDFNKDGYPDLVIAHDSSYYNILRNNGDGTFTRSSATISGARLRDVAVVLLAGNSIPDLVFTDWNANYIRVLSGNGSGGFSASVNYSTGGATDGIVAGDFNKDGYIDVAVAKRSASQVGVFLGTSGGGFNAIVNYGAGGAVMELAAGLVNGDTILDLVCANYTSDNIGVLLGNGSGGFGTVTTFSGGNDNTDVALGDVTSDGILDAVVCGLSAGGINILKGDGLGGFTFLATLPPGTNSDQVRLHDLNGDGRLDIAVAHRNLPSLSVILGLGYGHFTPAYQDHVDLSSSGLAIADFDGSSLPDIATVHSVGNTARVIKGVLVDADADALANEDESYYLASGANPDTDGDLLPDGLEVRYWCLRPAVNNGGVDSDGDGPSNLAEYQSGTDPCDGLSDTDGDGMDDAWENAHACLNPNVADGNDDFDSDTFTNIREYRLDSDPCGGGDGDGDGMPDGWEDQYSCVDKLVGDSMLDPDGDSLSNLEEFQIHTDPCVDGDDDWDGMPDKWEAVYGCLEPTTVDAALDFDNDYWNNLAEYEHTSNPCLWDDTDLDGMPDGWEDGLACVDRLTGDSTADPDGDSAANLREYRYFSDPCLAEPWWHDPVAFNHQLIYPTASDPLRLAAGDFNNDGNPDLAVAHDRDDYSILINNGDGSFTTTGGAISGARLRDAAVVVLAGDTILDVVFSDWLGRRIHVLTGNGGGTFTLSAQIPAGWAPEGIAAGDFNQDGMTDVVVTEQGISKVGVFLGNSSGSFDPVVEFDAGGLAIEVAVGLVDGDTKLDIVTANSTSNTISVLIGDGVGGFGPPRIIALDNGANDVALGDVTGDGVMDAAVASYGIVIMKGDGSGSFSPSRTITTNVGLFQVRLADLNGNGLLDLVATNQGIPGLSVALSHGYGYFTDVVKFLADRSALGLAVADFNPPTLLDVATTHSNATVRVIMGVQVDSDGDALADAEELVLGTDRLNPDSDGDGMPDGWEEATPCLDSLTGDSLADPDSDLVSNLQEYHLGRNPCVPEDRDGDLIPDYWEDLYSCMAANTVDDGWDYDDDLWSNLDEYINATDPCVMEDRDSDGMPDRWEENSDYGCLDPYGADGDQDPDGDDGTNLVEYQQGEDPCRYNDWTAINAFKVQAYRISGVWARKLAAGDLNKDGFVDLVSADYSGFSVLINQGGQGFISTSDVTYGRVYDIEIVQLAGDTIPDLVITDGSPPGVFKGNGDGSFTELEWLNFGSMSDGLAAADFDLDGLMDVAGCNWNWDSGGGITILPGDTGGSLDDSGCLFGTDCRQYPVYGRCVALAAGLLNADPWPDLVAAIDGNQNEDFFSVLLSDGKGGYVTSTYPYSQGVTLANQRDVVLNDFNGDGRLDAAISRYSSPFDHQDLTIFLGDGAGGFAETRHFDHYAWQLALADLNGDGFKDLAFGEDYEALGSFGNGLFTQPPESDSTWFASEYGLDPTFCGSQYNGAAAADFFPGGPLDVALSCGDTVYFSRNVMSDADLDTLSDLDEFRRGTNPNNPDSDGDLMPDGYEIAAGLDPFNDDTWDDPDFDYVSNLDEMNNGTDPSNSDSDGDQVPDGMESPYSCLDPAHYDQGLDYDGDLIPNEEEWWESNDPCVFTDNGGNGMADGWEMIHGCVAGPAGDPDGDGANNLFEYQLDRDPCVGDPSWPAVDFGRAETHTMRLGTWYPSRLASGDVNGDGFTDVITFDTYYYHVLLNQDDGSFAAKTYWAGPDDYLDAAVVALPGDSVLDMVLLDHNQVNRTLEVYHGDGAGAFDHDSSKSVGLVPYATTMTVRDLSRDGLPDVVTCRHTDQYLEVLLGTAGGSFSHYLNINLGRACQLLDTGYINGDTVPDLVSANDTSLSALLGNGLGGFGAPVHYAVNAYDTAVGDVDGDGFGDVVAVGGNNITILLGDGAGGLTVFLTIPAGNDPRRIALADFNHDGWLDVVTANAAGGISVVVGIGNGNFTQTYDIFTARPVTDVLAGDFDHSGPLDLALLYETGDTVEIRLGAPVDADGDLIAAGQEMMIGTNPNNPDSDGDGMPDGWEYYYGQPWVCPNPAVADAGEDCDMDWGTNLAEYLGGTSPCDYDDRDGD